MLNVKKHLLSRTYAIKDNLKTISLFDCPKLKKMVFRIINLMTGLFSSHVKRERLFLWTFMAHPWILSQKLHSLGDLRKKVSR